MRIIAIALPAAVFAAAQLVTVADAQPPVPPTMPGTPTTPGPSGPLPPFPGTSAPTPKKQEGLEWIAYDAKYAVKKNRPAGAVEAAGNGDLLLCRQGVDRRIVGGTVVGTKCIGARSDMYGVLSYVEFPDFQILVAQPPVRVIWVEKRRDREVVKLGTARGDFGITWDEEPCRVKVGAAYRGGWIHKGCVYADGGKPRVATEYEILVVDK